MDTEHQEYPDQNGAEQDNQTSSGSQALSLTSFLFGNIDSHGELESDVFDDECKKHLDSLSRLGLGNQIRQVTDDADDEDEEEEDEEGRKFFS